MPDWKQFFETPQKARLAIICLAAALATFGAVAVYIGYSLGRPGADVPPAQTEAVSDAPGESEDPVESVEPTQILVGTVPALTIEEALELALADAGTDREGAEVSREALAQDNGVWVYEFRFRTQAAQYEYKLNANTGEVRSKVKEIFVYPSPQPTEPVMPTLPPESAPPAESAPQTVPGVPPAASVPPSTVPSSTPGQSVSMYIGMDRAKTIALEHAGLTASQARFSHARMDRENGRMVYELEFRYNGVEYEYEIDAVTGRILDHEREPH